jgi:GAF domain-containing protein
MSTQQLERVAEVCVELSDTLVPHFTPLDHLSTLCERCVELLDITAAATVLSDRPDDRFVVAVAPERSRLREVLAVAATEGPGTDLGGTGQCVLSDAFQDEVDRWRAFGRAATAAGFESAHALPLRCRAEVVGMLALLHEHPHRVSDADHHLGQLLADTATIGLLQHRAVSTAEGVQAQLQCALTSRVLIEQAKGVLAQQGHVDVDDAFHVMRRYARAHNLRLVDVARTVTTGHTDFRALK